MRQALHANAGKDAKEKLRALKEAYLTHRQVGASEAAYKVNPFMKLKDSNITCIFVATGFPENRSVFYKKVHDDDPEDEDMEVPDGNESESDDEPEQQRPKKSKYFKIEGRPGTYQQSITVIDRYIKRPVHLEAVSYTHLTLPTNREV